MLNASAKLRITPSLVHWVVAFSLLLPAGALMASGAVVGDRGSCMIKIGFYDAHFTVYQPETRASKEFCEDLPDAGATQFVLDYLHKSLKKVPVDFRVIRDEDKIGRFARWEHVKDIPDIERRTVFYQQPVVRADGRLTIDLTFSDTGGYIGIVTAPHPSKDILYRAVFPFQVGGSSPRLLLVLGAAIMILIFAIQPLRRRLFGLVLGGPQRNDQAAPP